MVLQMVWPTSQRKLIYRDSNQVAQNITSFLRSTNCEVPLIHGWPGTHI